MAGMQSTDIATLDNQTLTSPDGFENAGDSDESKSKDSTFQPAKPIANTRKGGSARKTSNMIEEEKKAC